MGLDGCDPPVASYIQHSTVLTDTQQSLLPNYQGKGGKQGNQLRAEEVAGSDGVSLRYPDQHGGMVLCCIVLSNTVVREWELTWGQRVVGSLHYLAADHIPSRTATLADLMICTPPDPGENHPR